MNEIVSAQVAAGTGSTDPLLYERIAAAERRFSVEVDSYLYGSHLSLCLVAGPQQILKLVSKDYHCSSGLRSCSASAYSAQPPCSQ
jgi:hypothetical protein